jgi:phosphoribosyl 1,2-cyclic phosphodiesterase
MPGVRLRIWGCRGSVPTPGPDTVGYGGNTSCVEVLVGAETALVLDAGTGIRPLGLDLVARGVRRIHLFLTHLHFDHLEGLRFFAPLWDDAVTLEIWGPRSPVVSLRDRILRAFSPPLFPLDFRDVPARVAFHDLPAEPWRTNGLSLTADLVLHPGPTVGFRLETDRAALAYLPDHEPGLAGIEGRSPDWISAGALARGADIVLHDAQYFEDEYAARIGWGHSSVAHAVAFCRAVGAGRLVLFHHEPSHSDSVLEHLEDRARELAGHDGPAPVLAREGMVIDLGQT